MLRWCAMAMVNATTLPPRALHAQTTGGTPAAQCARTRRGALVAPTGAGGIGILITAAVHRMARARAVYPVGRALSVQAVEA